MSVRTWFSTFTVADGESLVTVDDNGRIHLWEPPTGKPLESPHGYAQGRRRVHLFSYLLSYSRRQYLRFVESQDLPTTLREHIRAFEHLGGAVATCLYDNMKVVVLKHGDEGPLYNPKFLAFATHYGFMPRACRVRRPQTKGKVERQFHYAETNLLNGRTFRSLEHLNEVTVHWLAEVADVRVHRQTKQRPIGMPRSNSPVGVVAWPATSCQACR